MEDKIYNVLYKYGINEPKTSTITEDIVEAMKDYYKQKSLENIEVIDPEIIKTTTQ
jgi:hypothetical protein